MLALVRARYGPLRVDHKVHSSLTGAHVYAEPLLAVADAHSDTDAAVIATVIVRDGERAIAL